MKHLYVTFRERKDYVEKTAELLKPLGVDLFFFSKYEKNPNVVIRKPEDLEALLERIKEICLNEE